VASAGTGGFQPYSLYCTLWSKTSIVSSAITTGIAIRPVATAFRSAVGGMPSWLITAATSVETSKTISAAARQARPLA